MYINYIGWWSNVETLKKYNRGNAMLDSCCE